MSQIKTTLTQLLNIRTPVVCAPMANVGGAKLAAHATLGGGFGFMAAGYGDANFIRQELTTARSILKLESTTELLPIGVGYLAWKLDEAGNAAWEMIDAALENKVQAIWLAFGNNLDRYIKYTRESDLKTGRRTVIFVLVNSLEEAQVAANLWRVDVLVAQGIESGGHGGSYAPPVFPLVSSILAELPENGPPVLAAGGISNGTQIGSFLTLGASGVALGTRFLLTPESLYSESQKAALLAANATSTVRSLAFDQARNTLGWPSGIDGRGLRNQITEDIENGVDVSRVREKFAAHANSGDPAYTIVWAGMGVGEMKEIKGTQEIVKELHAQTLQSLGAARELVVTAS